MNADIWMLIEIAGLAFAAGFVVGGICLWDAAKFLADRRKERLHE